jgi:hypothetical protein
MVCVLGQSGNDEHQEAERITQNGLHRQRSHIWRWILSRQDDFLTTATKFARVSLQLRILGLGFLQDGDVGIRIFPQIGEWRSQYFHLAMRRGRKIAKVAMARKLAVRMYWMWRKGWDYEQFVFHVRNSVRPDYERAYGWKGNTINESEMALFFERMQ